MRGWTSSLNTCNYAHIMMYASEDFEVAGELFKALANPLRLRILAELAEEPRCVHDLMELLAASQPLVSQHLRILRAARLVAGRRSGREMIYSLQDAHIAEIIQDALAHSMEES